MNHETKPTPKIFPSCLLAVKDCHIRNSFNLLQNPKKLLKRSIYTIKAISIENVHHSIYFSNIDSNYK